MDTLAAAAAKLGVSHVGPPLDTLDKHRLLKSTASGLALTHALAQDTWRARLSEPGAAELVSGWLAAFNQNKAHLLTSSDAAAIIPVIAKPLVENLSAVKIAQIGGELLKAGQVDVGLEFVDSGWEFKAGAKEGGDDMVQQALIAARTRLDLGRYSEVDEPLAFAERSTNAETRVEALLLRMKLALRRNTYSLLWVLAEQLERIAEDKEHYAEGQAALNVAYRDLLDYNGIRGTTDKLIQLRESLVPRMQMAIDRSPVRWPSSEIWTPRSTQPSAPPRRPARSGRRGTSGTRIWQGVRFAAIAGSSRRPSTTIDWRKNLVGAWAIEIHSFGPFWGSLLARSSPVLPRPPGCRWIK